MDHKISSPDEARTADRQLSQLLATLPRETTSEDFTARVLQRIETSPAKATILRWPGPIPLWAAAALFFIALTFGGREAWHRHQRQETIARYEALRAEHTALESELRRLRRLAVKTRPVLYLGGDESVEYVVDLSRPSTKISEDKPQNIPQIEDLSLKQLRHVPRRVY